MPEISQQTQALIQKYQNWQKSLHPKQGTPLLHVDEVASKVASFYEKIRSVVDWREEHLLRRAAIERALKRRLFLRKSGNEIAEPLVLELIRAGHFPNDRIEELKVEEVKRALNKYLYILEKSPSETEKFKGQLYNWLLSIAACEIEQILAPPLREKAIIEFMSEWMSEKIEIAPTALIYKKISEEKRKALIFIACQKALFKLDSPIITYYLLQKKYPDWSNLSEPTLTKIAVNIYSLWKDIENELKDPLAEEFYKICEKYDTAFLILSDILSENPSEAQKNLSNPETLEISIRNFYKLRLQKIKSRIARAAVFSTVSIFVTKILVALAIEVPFDKYVLGKFNYQSLGINILTPPLLMFLLVLTIKPPKKENLERVVMEVMKIVYKRDRKDVYLIKPTRKKGVVFGTVIAVFYLFTFIVSFGVIIWALDKLNFSILSMAIFLMFFSLIIFAGFKIRERAKELEIQEEKPSFLSILLDSFSLPFLRFGKWLSNQWVKYNVVVVLITAFLDMPFQFFAEFLEHWRTFLKEKKGEIH